MIDIKVPSVGESISEVTLVKWLKKEGDYVNRDELLCELESEKATFELNAEQAGTLHIVAAEGATLNIGDLACSIDETAAKPATAEPQASEAPKAEAPKKEGGEGKSAAADPLDAEMAQFKPAIRDSVITTLSSKSAAELSTVAGKELAKEQITEAVNGIFAGDREVLRVSFGDFIIQ